MYAHERRCRRRSQAKDACWECQDQVGATAVYRRAACAGSSSVASAQVLPEKEAKAITLQIVQGLAYLNEAPRHIIHYDLKPANILFDSFGQAKITVGLPPRSWHRQDCKRRCIIAAVSGVQRRLAQRLRPMALAQGLCEGAR